MKNLCDMFPVTAEYLKTRGAPEAHYLKAMLRLDIQVRTKNSPLKRNQNMWPSQEEMGIVKNLLKDTSTDSMLNKEGMCTLELAAANVEKFEVDGASPRGPPAYRRPGPLDPAPPR